MCFCLTRASVVLKEMFFYVKKYAGNRKGKIGRNPSEDAGRRLEFRIISRIWCAVNLRT